LSSHSWSVEPRYHAILTGHVDNVSSPDSIWVGAIEVRFRDIAVLEEKSAEALSFLRALAMRREVECRLSGERLTTTEGLLVGHCFIFGPTDGREIDLGNRLLERGFARACKEPQAHTAVWPPVYSCQ
jgi:endonuclease YncB( thermonuclease family)